MTNVPSVEEIRARMQGQKPLNPGLLEQKKKEERAEERKKQAEIIRRNAAMSQAPRDIRNYVQKKLEELGIDPVEELVELYNSGNLADKERRAIMQELLKYCAPQLKAMDIRAQLKGDIKVNIVNFDPADAIPMAEAPVEAEA